MTDDLYHRRLMENPFHILGVSPGHGIGTIRAHEAAIQLSHGPALAAWAVEQLLHPRTRLDAELGWVHDVPEDLVGGLLIGIEERSLEEIMAKCGDLGPLDRITIAMDLIAARRPDIGLSPLPWLMSGWDQLDAARYLARINEMRASAGEALIDGAAFAAGLGQLRHAQSFFIEELVMRGGGTADEALKAAAMSFILGESGRLPEMPITEPDAPAVADARTGPSNAMRTQAPVPAEDDGSGLFEEAHPDVDDPGDGEPGLGHDPQHGYQDQALMAAIMGIQEDKGEDEGLPADDGVPSLPARRKTGARMAVAAGILVAVVLGVSFGPLGDEGPRRMAHAEGEQRLASGRPRTSDELVPASQAMALKAPAIDTPPLPDPEPMAGRMPKPSSISVMKDVSVPQDPSSSLNPDPFPSSVANAGPDADIADGSSRPEPPMASLHHDAAPLPQLAAAPPARPAPRLQLKRPPHGNDDPMSIEEIRYCHAEFMILERLPAFVETEAARRAMLFRALEHVSRCEGGSRTQAELDRVVWELRDYDFTADARRDAGKW